VTLKAPPDLLHGHTRHALWLVVVALGYFAAAKLGLSLAFATKQVTALWPPTGLALAALLLGGYRVWPAIWVAAFAINATIGDSMLVAAGLAVGNTLGPVAAAAGLRRFADFDNSLGTVRDVLALVVIGAGLGMAITATSGVANLALGGVIPWSAYASVWWVWWVGDAMGVVVVAPLVLSWAARPRLDLDAARLLELGLLFLGLVIAGFLALVGTSSNTSTPFQLQYAVFPFIMWMGLRFGARETTAAVALVTGLAVWGAIQDRGPFTVGNLDQRLILLEMFMAVAALTGLILSAVTAERSQAQWALQQANDDLERRVVERTAELAQADRLVRASLREKEVLLQEIHHRVKNNLQVISSLINMQARAFNGEAGRAALEECQARVQTISLIHEKLYQASDYSRVPFDDYVRTLADNVFMTGGGLRGNLALKLDLEEVSLPMDKAIPCGLILNELMTNTLKHAFPDDRPGTISVALRRTSDREMVVSVADDGTGAEPGSAAESFDTLGMRLVSALADQLNGRMDVSRRGGTRVSIAFPAA
jgi:two-component sensor histidine kinase/integral membrane sensor domain MASE1